MSATRAVAHLLGLARAPYMVEDLDHLRSLPIAFVPMEIAIVCNAHTKDLAQEKIAKVVDYAQANGYIRIHELRVNGAYVSSCVALRRLLQRVRFFSTR